MKRSKSISCRASNTSRLCQGGWKSYIMPADINIGQVAANFIWIGMWPWYFYVKCRGYTSFGLSKRILDSDSSFVCRLCDDWSHQIIKGDKLTDLIFRADVIALIFRNRWATEIFFRFFKRILSCHHLLSQCKNGSDDENVRCAWLDVYKRIHMSFLDQRPCAGQSSWQKRQQ